MIIVYVLLVYRMYTEFVWLHLKRDSYDNCVYVLFI